MPKNPARPEDSPIKVTNAGGWNPYDYHNRQQKPTPVVKPVPNARAFASPADYQQHHSESAQIDRNIERAIQQDLAKRNIRTKNQ